MKWGNTQHFTKSKQCKLIPKSSMAYFAFQQKHTYLTVLPHGYQSNTPLCRLIMNISAPLTAQGKSKLDLMLRQLAECQSVRNIQLTPHNPPSSLLLYTPFLSLSLSRGPSLPSSSIQCRLNIGQHSLKSSSCWKFDKCTPGGSEVNIKFVIGGPEYPPLALLIIRENQPSPRGTEEPSVWFSECAVNMV